MKTIALWVLTFVTVAMFALAGTMKLAGAPEQVQLFGVLGLGQWFRYVTGALEVGGATGLLFPPVAGYAAMMLASIMVAAVATHLLIVGGNPAAAVFLLATSLTIAWLRLRTAAASSTQLARA